MHAEVTELSLPVTPHPSLQQLKQLETDGFFLVKLGCNRSYQTNPMITKLQPYMTNIRKLNDRFAPNEIQSTRMYAECPEGLTPFNKKVSMFFKTFMPSMTISTPGVIFNRDAVIEQQPHRDSDKNGLSIIFNIATCGQDIVVWPGSHQTPILKPIERKTIRIRCCMALVFSENLVHAGAARLTPSLRLFYTASVENRQQEELVSLPTRLEMMYLGISGHVIDQVDLSNEYDEEKDVVKVKMEMVQDESKFEIDTSAQVAYAPASPVWPPTTSSISTPSIITEDVAPIQFVTLSGGPKRKFDDAIKLAREAGEALVQFNDERERKRALLELQYWVARLQEE
jgi:hypothetical protein